MKRRHFLRRTAAAAALLAVPRVSLLGANDDIRVGAIGMGSYVKIGGKGRGDTREFQRLPGVRVTALSDCDTYHLGRAAEGFKKEGGPVKTYRDFRELLDDKEIDAVTIATPNHWHALMTILACQAGKDVFVQKPATHSILEGRTMVAAMRKYGRVVQATHGPRNSGAVEESYEYVHDGHLGKMLYVYGVNYKPRLSIGKVQGPRPIPPSCDYDLWCGPAAKEPLRREHLHYDWHWDWNTGNGDLGNMGIHYMDAARWALRQSSLPRRVLSVGGRFGYDDDGETPNTLLTVLDYEPAPIIFEVRGLPRDASARDRDWARSMDRYRGVRIGTVVHCEGGYVTGGAAFSSDGRKIRTFERKRASTKANFIEAVRSRQPEKLFSDALEGHLSGALVHMANICYRVGQGKSAGEVREAIQEKKELVSALERLEQHLAANRIDVAKTPLVLGPMLTLNPESERFEGPFAVEANRLVTRKYREPFTLPEAL